MNSTVTDHQAYEIDNREQYRQMLIASRRRQHLKNAHNAAMMGLHRAEDLRRRAIDKEATFGIDYDFHGESASIWECIALSLFAAAMLAGLALAILWGLR